MEYLSICFEEQCRLNDKQIICARNPDSQLHQSHTVEDIHPNTPFIRSLKTKPIKFHYQVLKMRAQLQEQYERSVQRVKLTFKAGLQQFERKIRGIYELNGEKITLNLFEPHLRQNTPQTELWLTLINWKKDHPTEDIKEYIQRMPEMLINEYKVTTNNLVDYLISNLPKPANKLCEQSYQAKLQYSKTDFNGGSRIIKEISKQISGIYERSIEPQEIPRLSEVPLAKKIKSRKEDTLKQLAEVFCTSRSELRYDDIGESLRDKIAKIDRFNSIMQSIMTRVCLNIEIRVSKNSEYGNRFASKIDLLWTEFMDYRTWMQQDEADIFIKCVRFFTGVNRDIAISREEMDRVYVVIICRTMDREIRGGDGLSADQLLEKQLIYLYYKFGSFSTVNKMLMREYSYSSQAQVRQKIQKTWKKIVVGTYNQIKQKESIQNANFQMSLFWENDFGNQTVWGAVVQKYVRYQFSGIIDQSERKSLEDTMRIAVSKERAFQTMSSKITHSSLQTIAKDEINSSTASVGCSVETMIEQSSRSLQYSTLVIKNEQFSNSKLNDCSTISNGSYLLSALPH